MRFVLARLGLLVVPAVGLAGCGSGDWGPAPSSGSAGERVATTSAALTGNDVANLALANVGGMACKTNSLGGSSFDSSCTGNGGLPEYWCADFARWAWEHTGAGNASELTAAAGSFYVYGQNHGTLHQTPSLGDAVVYNYQGGGVADHVALVSKVNSDGTIETVSGDWNGQSGSEATFSSTSHVVLNSPAYPGKVGTSPGVMGMTISGFISPVGLVAAAPYGASFVSQTFPLATTPLTMFAGQTIKASIVLKNGGSAAWDASTKLGTTQPRDRASAFADASWLAPNRAVAVSGTVKPGAQYSFDFVLHAPSKPGTYLEYFDLVEESVAWFGDPGQGGPPDDDLEANIVVVAGVRGNLDGVDCAAGITGWTQDQAVPDTAIGVDVYFDVEAGQPGATPTKGQADVNRADLCKAIGSCVHGFTVPVPAAVRDGKEHKVYAYGIAATGSGPDELLPASPKTFTCEALPPGSDAGAPGGGDAGGTTGSSSGASSGGSSGSSGGGGSGEDGGVANGDTGTGASGGCSIASGTGSSTCRQAPLAWPPLGVGLATAIVTAAAIVRRRRKTT